MLEGAARRGELFLSAISVWETAQKASKGRLQMQASIEELMEVSFGDGSIRLLDLTTGILIAANRLPGKIHGDPADRILAATARLRECVIVTHDIELRRYGKQGHVQIHKV